MAGSRIARKVLSVFAGCALLLTIGFQSVQACTGIRLVAADGTVVYARTLEFAVDIHSDVITVPARLRPDRKHTRWQGRAQVEGEVRQRRGQRPWDAAHFRRAE